LPLLGRFPLACRRRPAKPQISAGHLRTNCMCMKSRLRVFYARLTIDLCI
jgi:hypothetical protein